MGANWLDAHECDRDESWEEFDGRGIYLCRVCSQCVRAKLAQYRPEILNGHYDETDVDEQIESEPEAGGW